jgi:hypothetical protein
VSVTGSGSNVPPLWLLAFFFRVMRSCFTVFTPGSSQAAVPPSPRLAAFRRGVSLRPVVCLMLQQVPRGPEQQARVVLELANRLVTPTTQALSGAAGLVVMVEVLRGPSANGASLGKQ